MNSDQMMQFVELYHHRECLRSVNSPLYKNCDARDKSLQEISAEINNEGFGPREVAQKIKNLRTTYYREVNKIAVSKKSTSS
jgi:hypothetical protein